jgi:2-isopropylmalate synthase
MAMKVRNDIMPFRTGIDTTKIMNISAPGLDGFGLSRSSSTRPSSARTPSRMKVRHPSGRHAEERRDVRDHAPRDIGLTARRTASGQAFRPPALRTKMKELGFDLADNQLNDVFVRFKALADRKKEVYDDDLLALMKDHETNTTSDYLQLKRLRVVCGTDGPQEAELTMTIDGADHSIDATGDGPVDAAFNAVRMLYPHNARLQLYQVHAVTEGTDAQATVSVKIEEDGRIATGQSADTDTIVASVRAYVSTPSIV